MTDLLSIGASSTQLYRVALGTVSNNIANLNNDAYSRQETSITDNAPAQVGVVNIGTGARLESIRRNYDSFVEGSLRQSTSSLNTEAPVIEYASRILDLMGSEDGSLTNAVDRFFASLNQLELEPSSLGLRNELLASAQFLAARVRNLGDELAAVGTETTSEMRQQVDTVNALAASLLSVNRQLDRNVSLQKQPAQLLDQRDKLLRELSGLIAVDVEQNTNGSVVVRVGGTATRGLLVDSQRTRTLDLVQAVGSPLVQGLVLDAFGMPGYIGPPASGSLAGLMRVQATVLEPLANELDYFTNTFVDSINAVHRGGLDMENRLGEDLFAIVPGYAVLDAAGSRAAGFEVLSTTQSALGSSELRFLGNGRWQLTNLAEGSSRVLQEQGGPTERLLDADGLQLRVTAAQTVGATFRVQRSSRDAQDLQLLVDDPVRVAAAQRLRIDQPVGNQRRYEVDIDYGANTASASLLPGLSLGYLEGRNLDKELALNSGQPVLSVPGGFGNFAISLPAQIDAAVSLQVVTDQMVHVAGTAPVGAGFAQTLANSGLYDGFRYDVSSLNLGYPGTDLFIGARAERELETARIPLQAAGLALEQGSLSLNGVALNALTLVDTDNQPAAIAAWLNNQTAATGVRAIAGNTVRVPSSRIDLTQGLALNGVAVTRAIDVGELVGNINQVSTASGVRAWRDASGDLYLTNNPGREGESISIAGDASLTNALGVGSGEYTGTVLLQAEGKIELGLESGVSPADLARLGLGVTLYGSNAGAAGLHIYLDGTGQSVAAAVKASAVLPPPPRQLEDAFAINFVDHDGELFYRVSAAESGQLLFEKRFDAATGINVGTIHLEFDANPVAGDSFVFSPNLDALGDNSNLRALSAVEHTTLFRGQALNAFYVNEVNKVGTAYELAKMSQAAADIVNNENIEKRAAISGVNLDQEAADLMRYQQAFQAAAQVIQVATRLFDAIMSVR